MAPTEDSVSGVLGALRESAVALQAGAGIGLDFSHLRPRGTCVAEGAAPTAGHAASPMVLNLPHELQDAVAVDIHVPASTSCTVLGGILRRAWQLRLKNCRVSRANHAGNRHPQWKRIPSRQ
jgi:hypothetical protein